VSQKHTAHAPTARGRFGPAKIDARKLGEPAGDSGWEHASTWFSEAHLVQGFVEAVRQSTPDSCVVTEYPTGHGLPDVLVVHYDPSVARHRLSDLKGSVPRGLDRNCAYTLAYLAERRWVCAGKVRADLRFRAGIFDATVRRLRLRRLVDVTSGKLKLRGMNRVMAIRQVQAVEAKLNGWRRAAEQAERHRWFTPNASILLPHTPGRNTDRIADHCARRQLGFFTLDERGLVHRIVEGRRGSPPNTHLAWMLNEHLLDTLASEPK